MADFLLALTEFDRDQLWRQLGHTSLFSYLRRELGLSAGAAQHRKTAVELIRAYPEVEAALREGRLCLSSVCELARVVTPENLAEVLPRFYGLSRREAEVVAASIRPRAVVPEREVVTAIPAPLPAPADVAGREPSTAARAQVHPGELALRIERPSPAPPPAVPARPADLEEPLTGELSRFHLTVSRQFIARLQETKDALSHSHPGASTEEILMACMELMLAKKARQKGLVDRPLKTPRPSRTDHVPAHVRREVMKRSGGRCEWVFESGERCGSTYQVECDHIDPRARGGPATVANLRAACRPHDVLAARRAFGDSVMDRYTRERRRSSPRRPAAEPAAPLSHRAARRTG